MSEAVVGGDGTLEYIVAASKPWHRAMFEDRRRNLPGRWTYVESKRELEEILQISVPRYIFFLHWNWLVPENVVAEHECVCFHMTDLPFGRGGSPLQHLILKGRVETRLTALRMVAEMDAGPVYAKRRLDLDGSAEEIYLRAAAMSWDLVEWIVQVQPQPEPQSGAVTVFHRRTPEDSRLPTASTVPGLYDFIRMLDAPTYPKAFIEYGCFRIEFYGAKMAADGLEARATIQAVGDSSDAQ